MSGVATARKLEVDNPVPADIVIAQSIAPLPIASIAEATGLSSDDFELYGNAKAKVE